MTETTKITTLDNGPFLVAGSVLLTDGEGNPFPLKSETIALCRCSSSTTRPFCDGTHVKVGFQAAERADEQKSQS
jgi:3-phenylpropionate/trans-cinnamate dioxygenase ferredoxin subunit